MGCIYVIKNDINDKVYVGKTLSTIEKRFKEHCADSKRRRCEKRPQYNAMNKYGIEHFYIELLEECRCENLDEREIFWIEKLNALKDGYNATKGGEGKPYLNLPEDEICEKYLSGMNMKDLSELYSCDPASIRKVLISNGIPLRGRIDSQQNRDHLKKPVKQIDKKTKEVINHFPSLLEAEKHFGNMRSGHIGAVCRGKRKSAYGYIWEFDNLFV